MFWVLWNLGLMWTATVRLLEVSQKTREKEKEAGFVFAHPPPFLLKNHRLVTSGPYACARHPMYSAFALFTLCVWLTSLNWLIGLLITINFLYAAGGGEGGKSKGST